MTAPRRNPLQKEKFLEGNRQRWALLLILCAGGVLLADMQREGFDPEPYLTFLMAIGCVFLAGMSVDSISKIRTAGDLAKKEGAYVPDGYRSQEPDFPYQGK